MAPCTCTTDPNATTCPCRACGCYMIEEGTERSPAMTETPEHMPDSYEDVEPFVDESDIGPPDEDEPQVPWTDEEA